MVLQWFRLGLMSAVLSVGVLIAAQEGGHGGHGGHGEHEHDHGEMMMDAMPTLGPEVTIRFVAMVGDRPAACGIIYRGLGTEASPISLNDFRFYVSNVRMVTADGEEVPVELVQDGMWQYNDVALLDFEDGTGLCSGSGTPEMNDKVVGTIPTGEYAALRFDLGVPFELNHLDTATAPAPLNLPAMWWNWRAGYKFVRIDMQTPTSAAPQYFIHLGSTGCVSDSGSTPPSEPCANPNVATVELMGFNPLENFVVADLAALLMSVNLNENTPQPPGCMSGVNDPDCVGLFPSFGLDLETGLPVEGQRFFRAQ
ncbi:MAG: MbnP family copper-binding protein [Anaerolineae bacterium]